MERGACGDGMGRKAVFCTKMQRKRNEIEREFLFCVESVNVKDVCVCEESSLDQGRKTNIM